MYAKLSLRNAKRSIRDYLIYIVTTTMCVVIFYAFMALSSSNYKLQINENFKLGNFYLYMKMSTLVITTVMVFLIGYVNRYMIKKRMREFASYITLGMGQLTLAAMFFMESLIIGFVSIVIGIFFGVLFSQVLTVIILKAVGQKPEFMFTLYPDTVGITFAFFMGMFVLNGFINIIVIYRLKLIDMINYHKKSEVKLGRHKWIYGGVFILSVTLYVISLSMVKYFGIYSAIGLVLGTYGLFISATWIIGFIKDKVEFIRFNNTNLFLLGDLMFKVKSNSLALANVSICLILSAGLFLITPMLSGWAEGYLQYRVVYSLRITEGYAKDSLVHCRSMRFEDVSKFMEEQEYGVKDKCLLDIKTLDNGKKALSLSQFNKLREMAGYNSVELGEGKFAIHWAGDRSEESIKKVLESKPILKLGDKEYSTEDDLQFDDTLGEAITFTSIIIVPDKEFINLQEDEVQFYVNAERDLKFHEAEELLEFIREWEEPYLKEYGITRGHLISPRVLAYEKNNILNVSTTMKLQGIYAGVILFIISLTILALQQLGDAMEHKKNFQSLKKIGVDDSEINKVILKELGVYFGVPLLVAFIGTGIFLRWYTIKYENQLRLFVGGEKMMFNIMVAGGTVMIIYIAYFIAAYFGVKRNIEG